MQTLLTGFGPFGNVVSNPTERLLQRFAAEETPGHDLSFCLLPVSYTRAPQLLREAIDRGGCQGRPFDTVLMLGVAARSPHWRVERYGRNVSGALMDADGQTAPGPLLAPGAPEALPVTLPVEPMLQALTRIGLPAVFSDSAGAYLCNVALFTALQHLQQTGHPAKAGFLHVPADEQTFAPTRPSPPAATPISSPSQGEGEILKGSPQNGEECPIFPFRHHVQAVRAVLDILGRVV